MTDVAGIYARESTYLDRYVQVGIAQGRVISVSFPMAPVADAESSHDLLDRIEEYLQGSKDDFTDVEVALTMPTDQREVIEQVREIPFGEDTTVHQLARMTPGFDADSEEDLARVRETLGENPVPLLVPDHRVRDGSGATPASIAEKLRSLEEL